MIPQATPTPTKATPPRCTAFGAALVLGLLKLLIRAHLGGLFTVFMDK